MSLGLVVALQKLFFHLMHGNKSAINPSEALSLIVDDKGEPIVMGDELDLGEFLINFLERVKEGVLLSSQLATYDKIKRPNNPIDSLFFGTCKEKITYENSRTNSESSREISLGPINLSLEQKDVLASLKAYMNFDVEKTEQGRLIQGRKEIIITKTPKVLTLLPQRVTYHPTKGLVKVADALEVPRRISLDCFVKRDNNDKSSVAKLTNRLEVLSDLNRPINEISTENYKLHSAIIHDGDAVSGHYYTLVYHELKRQWIRFNDSVVSHISEQEGFDLVRGGGGGGVERKHMPCGYCVFYVKEDFESSQAHLSTKNKRNIGEKVTTGRSQALKDLELSTRKQEIIDLYLANIEHITIQATKWDQSLNDDCQYLPSIPSFHAFLFSNLTGCIELAQWTILNVTVHHLYKDIDNNDYFQINLKDTLQRKCLEEIIKDFLSLKIEKNLILAQKYQEILIEKQKEYKDLLTLFAMLKAFLIHCNAKAWKESNKALSVLDNNLYQFIGNKFSNHINRFFGYLFRVFLLEICEEIKKSWIRGDLDHAVSLADLARGYRTYFRWFKINHVFNNQLITFLIQLTTIATSHKNPAEYIEKIKCYKDYLANYLDYMPKGKYSSWNSQNESLILSIEKDSSVFYDLQAENEDLGNIYIQWRSNCKSSIETERILKEKNAVHCPPHNKKMKN